MAHNYEEFPFNDIKHCITSGKNNYRNKFFHDIDLSFILEWMREVDPEGKDYTIRIVDEDKLELIDGSGAVVSEVTIPGASAIIPEITANATVNAATGTPSVTVTKTGPTSNPNFNFAFENLKGEKGDKGEDSTVPGPAGQDGQNGRPFAILGKYPTYAAMIAAHPVSEAEIGDAYQVGEPDEYYTKTEVDDLLEDKADVSDIPDMTDYYYKSEVDDIVDDIRQVPTGGNNGDVLTKATTGPMWAPPVKELPIIGSGDAGKVLAVNTGETGVEWVPQSSGGGGAVIPITPNPGGLIWEIYDQDIYYSPTKLYDRSTDQYFDFVAGNTYYLRLGGNGSKTPFSLEGGKSIFFDSAVGGWIEYAMTPGVSTFDFSTYDQALAALGTQDRVNLIPYNFKLNYDYFSNGNVTFVNASVIPVRESGDQSGVVLNKCKYMVGVRVECTTSFRFEPTSVWGADIGLTAQSGIADMVGSDYITM